MGNRKGAVALDLNPRDKKKTENRSRKLRDINPRPEGGVPHGKAGDRVPPRKRTSNPEEESGSGIGEIIAKVRYAISGIGTGISMSKERILCGVVTFAVMMVLALLQTTLFSRIKPFGSVPDLMLSFTVALAVTEGRRWGAVWGIVAAVFIESLNVPNVFILPILYMMVGYFSGVICRHYLTESFAVRGLLAVAVLPLRGVFTAIYALSSPLHMTAGEIFFDIVLPEAASTLLLSVPVHIIVYFCMKPFHHTRAEMVSER